MSGLSSEEIKNVYKEGRKFYSKYFTIFFLSSSTLKVSAVVSKKISKKAVIRNKIKRRIRHLARLYLEKGKFVIIAKSDISDTDFEALENDFKKISTKVYKSL